MNRSEKFDEIRILADAVCDDEITLDQMARLEKLLSESDEARKFYLNYVGLHAQMEADSNPQFEVVLRRLQVDELIIRSTGSGGGSIPPDISDSTTGEPIGISGEITRKSNVLLYSILLLSLLLVGILSYLLIKSDDEKFASISQGVLSHEQKGLLKNQGIGPGVYTVKEKAKLTFLSGEVILLSESSRFEIKNNNELILQSGDLTKEKVGTGQLDIHTAFFTVNGAKFDVEVQEENSSIKTENDPVLLIPKRWKPKHYWSFDDKQDRVVDLAGHAYGVLGKTTQRTLGLIGSGALKFENRESDFVDVGSGGGTALATGSFSVTDGVTIEALFKTNWSGEKMDYDEIFRKDQDGNLRMLLSFQNDSDGKNSNMTMPKVKPGPTLSFGLFLVGEGYHELELLLDGQEGRPTLEELKNQKLTHVVASYDVVSGVKALYLNGRKLAFYQYTPGTKMLSGGPGKATIGNSPNAYKEPFSGIIDEVAFYDFALPAFMVDYHFKLIGRDKNYFSTDDKQLPATIEIKLPASSKIKINSLTGLPE